MFKQDNYLKNFARTYINDRYLNMLVSNKNMAKNLFDDEYFTKHRDNSEWNSLKKRGLSALNIKNKPKPKEIEPLPKVEEQDEDLLEYKKEIRASGESKISEYKKMLTAGFAGGFIVLLILQTKFLEKSILTADFWLSAIVIVIIVLFFVLLFEIPFKLANK